MRLVSAGRRGRRRPVRSERLPALRGRDSVGPAPGAGRSRPGVGATSASSTSTRRDRARTWRPRWPGTSGIARCSSARTHAPRSTRAAPTTCRSSCPTSRACSRAAPCRSTSCFVNATPPDAHGFCSLGTRVEAMHAAIRAAKTVDRPAEPVDAADARRQLHPRRRHRPRRRGRRPTLRPRQPDRSATSSAGSAPTSPTSCRTERRSSWGSARSRPRRRWR